MASGDPLFTRRAALAGGIAGTALAGLRLPARAAGLIPTPTQSEGPFYPVELPPDTDWDLLRMAGAAREALGTVTYVEGRILDLSGRPVPDTRVEIWQCDASGRYHLGEYCSGTDWAVFASLLTLRSFCQQHRITPYYGRRP